MDTDADANQLKQFTLEEVAEAAGSSRGALSLLRNRSGLFGSTVDRKKTKKFFSVVDVCVARAVTILTKHGMAVPDAIWFADGNLRTAFIVLLSGKPFSSLVAFAREDAEDGPHLSFHMFRRSDKFADIIAKTSGIVTVIDLVPIMHYVLAALDKRKL